MPSRRYKIVINRNKDKIIQRYKSEEKLEIGAEILLFYEDKYHLVKILSISRLLKYQIKAEEV